MDARQYDMAQRVFLEVCDLAAGERTRHLAQVCGNDPQVAAAVRGMLAAEQQQFALTDGVSRRERLLELLEAQAALDAAPEPIPDRIGPYRVIRKVGQGGMGTVYEAEQEQPRRAVAVKVLRQGADSAAMLRRFRREIELLGRLQHPGIAQIYGAGAAATPSGSVPYFAMEFVRGESLTRFAEDHHLSVEQRLRQMAQVCDAVHFAHQKGVLHRDLKPANILVSTVEAAQDVPRTSLAPDPFVLKILDFGIARALDDADHQRSVQTDVGQIVGTLSYMSPEQFGGVAGVDIRADVYALGVIMYELLSGHYPHDVRSRSLAQAARIVAFDPPTRLSSRRPEFRGDLEAIVNKAIEQDPARRYPSASELAADIRRFLAHEPVTARPLTTFYQIARFTRRNRGLVSGLAATAVALLLGVAGTSIGLYRSVANERRAIAGETRARLESYSVALAAADAISASDPVRAIRLLDAAPADLRGWEWNHYRNRLDHVVAVFEGESGAVAAVDPRRGPIAAVARGGTIQILSLPGGELLATCAGQGTLSRPVLSRSGSHVAAIRTVPGGNPSLVVFDTTSAAVAAELPAAEPTFCLSPDGRWLALENRGRELEVHDLSSRTVVLRRPPVDPAGSRSFRLQPRGCITILEDRSGEAAAEIVDIATGTRSVRTGAELAAADPLDRAGDLLIANPAFSLDRRAISLVTAADRTPVSLLKGHSDLITAAALSNDAARVATAAQDNTVRVWDVPTGRTQAVIPVESTVRDLDWTADGSAIACTDARGRALLLSLGDPCVRVLRGHKSFVYHAAFSNDTTLVASASWDDAVRVWDAASGAPVAVLDRAYGPIYPPTLMGFTRDGASLFVVEQGDTASVWGLPAIRAGRAVRDASSPLARTIAADPWSVATSSARWSRLEGGQLRAVSSPGDRLAQSTGDGLVHVTDARHRVLRTIVAAERHLTAVAISPDERTLATCGDESTVKLWDIDSGRSIRSLLRHSGRVYSIDFSPDGKRLATAGNDNTIIIWDTDSWQPLAELRGHSQYVNSVSFSPDGTRLVSASGDGAVRIWDSLTRPQRLSRSAPGTTPFSAPSDPLSRGRADPGSQP